LATTASRSRATQGASELPDRGGGVRLPRPALHRAGAARGSRRGGGRPGWDAAFTGLAGRPARATATATPTGRTGCTRSSRWRRRPSARLLVPRSDRPHRQPRDCARALARASRDAAGDRRIAQSSFRGRRGRRHSPPETPPRASGCCTAVSWRFGRTRRSTIPTSSWPATTWSWPPSTSRDGRPGAADGEDAGCDSKPERRHHCPPRRSVHRLPRRSGPGLGRGVFGGCTDRYGPRAERLGRAARPLRRSSAPSLRVRLRLCDRFGRPSDRGARQPALGHRNGAAGMAHAGPGSECPLSRELLEWAAGKPGRIGASAGRIGGSPGRASSAS